MFRIGFGYDVHRLVEGRSLILGGVAISHHHGLMGHSDADVLTHAVMDALLGAIGKGDIGQHFPDTDPAYKGVDSLQLLRRVVDWVKQEGFQLNNVDATLVAESPRLAPYVPAMRERLSPILEIPADGISIKATTSEGLGFCGRKEGIAAYAVVSLVSSPG